MAKTQQFVLVSTLATALLGLFVWIVVRSFPAQLTCGQKAAKASEEIKLLEVCSQVLNCHVDIEDVRYAKSLADSAVKCAKE